MATQTRSDILPVILGGDKASYPLAREFHEAFGVRSICVVPAPLKIIEKSKIIDHYPTAGLGEDDVRAALLDLAQRHSDKKLVVMMNSDAAVETAERVVALGLPDNVICQLPPHDVMLRASDKVEFARMCEQYGLDAPRSEVVSLAGDAPIAPTKIAFPLVAKPTASSIDYTRLYAKGFKKIYFVREQAELDQLWHDLRAEGYEGGFLVQELIEGDDTYVDMITIYVNRSGKPTMFVSSQVLLEEHAPTLFGNPAAMITRPMPELWEKVAHMLTDIGWRGFANFDMKRDPRSGRTIFMDFNPRIGANSYYAVAGGVNPMRTLIDDVVDGTDEVRRIDREALYTRTPVSLVRRYLVDPALRAEFDAIVRRGDVYNPMRYPADGWAARQLGLLMTENYVRKFRQYYPHVTSTSF